MCEWRIITRLHFETVFSFHDWAMCGKLKTKEAPFLCFSLSFVAYLFVFKWPLWTFLPESRAKFKYLTKGVQGIEGYLFYSFQKIISLSMSPTREHLEILYQLTGAHE